MRFLKRTASWLGLAIGLAVGLAVPIPAALAQTPVAEAPLYLVEIILFAHNDGNPGDEDFHHGSDALIDEPALRRLSLPNPALDSLFDIGLPETGGPPGSGGNGVPAAAVDARAAGAAAAAASAADSASADSASAQALATQTPGNSAQAPGDALPRDALELFAPYSESSGAGNGGPETARARLPADFRALTAEALELGDVRRTLDRIGTRPYRVLAHTGWIQRGLDETAAVPVDLKRLGITNPIGTIELRVGRYFYVALDLDYVRGDGTFWTAPVGTTLAPLEYAERIAIHAERFGIRRDRLNYIDHPMLGVLVEIRLAPEPAPTEAQPGGPAG